MNFSYELTLLSYAGVSILGALIGSFLNVVIIRLPRTLEHEWSSQCRELLELESSCSASRPPGILWGRSNCPKCGHDIRWLENIPIFSFLFLKGRCSQCRERISPRYPIVELLTAILFLLTIWQLGLNAQGVAALVLTSYLIVAASIDIDHKLLPDIITIPLLWAGIVVSLNHTFTDLYSSVIGAICGYLCLWLVFHIFRLLTGKEGMGYGDFKLLAALGAWLGWQMLPIIILLSSVTGAITGIILMGIGRLNREQPMPFGPYIAIAGWIALIFGENIMTAYLSMNRFQ